MKKTIGLITLIALLAGSAAYATTCMPQGATQENPTGDNTANLKNCIAIASSTDRVVYLGGQYLITEQIVVPKGVMLRGPGTLWGAEIDIIDFGKNMPNTDSEHAAIVLSDGASIDGLTFLYPSQTKGKQLLEYPPTVSINGSSCIITNSYFPNSYVGIDASVPHGQLRLINLQAGVYYRFIRDDQCYDIDKFIILHTNPGMWATWVDDSEVITWMFENSAMIEVSRIDWLYAQTIFAWGVKYGILINSSSHGSVGEAQIIQAGCDACRYGIYSNISTGGRPWLITISNYSGTAFNPVGGKGDGVSIYLAHVEGVNISNPNFWGVRNQGIYVEDSSSVAVIGANFITGGWDIADSGFAAIHFKNVHRGSISNSNGSTSRKLSLGILLEGSQNITVNSNHFEGQISGVKLDGSSGIKTFGNGCVLDMSNDSSNTIDELCYLQPDYTPTPTPTATSIPTINPTATPTPTPTATSTPTINPTPTPTPTRGKPGGRERND